MTYLLDSWVLIELKTYFDMEIYTQVFMVSVSVIESNLGTS